MSEQGDTQEKLVSVNSGLVVNTRLLWSGISVTNKKLESNVKSLNETSKSLKDLTKILVAFSASIKSAITDSINKLAVTLAESTFHLDNQISKVVGAIVNLTDVFDSESALTGYDLFYKASKEERDTIYKMLKYTTGEEGKPGSIDWTKQIELFNGNITRVEQSSLVLADYLAQAFGGNTTEWLGWNEKLYELLKSKTGGVSGKEESKYEGKSSILKAYYENLPKAKEGLEKLGEAGKNFGKRQVIKGLQEAKSFVTGIIDLATSPVTEGIMKPLKALGTILNVILIPLKPFLFLLELIGKVLEAAFAPLQIYMWQELSSTFGDLVSMIPELQAQTVQWIEDNGGLKEIIDKIIGGVQGLINALINGDLMTRLLNLSMRILGFASSLATPGFLSNLITIGDLFLKLAQGPLTVLYTMLKWITDIPIGLLIAMGIGLASLVGLLTLGLPGLIAGALIGTSIFLPLAFMQQGGEVPYTGPIYAHKGETVHPAGKDDQIIDLLEQNVYLQRKMLRMQEEQYR